MASGPPQLAPVLLCSTDDGGAGIAARRLDAALRGAGIPSRLVCARPSGEQSPAIALRKPTQLLRRVERTAWIQIERRLAKPSEFIWNDALHGLADASDLRALGPRPLNIHWVARDVASLEAFAQLDVPMVLTLHDMWPFTGGCHYAGDCEKWRVGCGTCPALGSSSRHDRSRLGAWRKRRAFGRDGVVVVTPSRWLRDLAQQSFVLGNARCVAIPNPLDTGLFCPGDRAKVRSELGLPADAFVVLFSADNPGDRRKGFDLFARAVESVRAELLSSRTRLLVMGRGSDELRALGLPTDALGYVTNEQEMIRAYRAADLLVAPSREDNYPNVISEAAACGCPTLAFAIGGIPEMVQDGVTGLLAPSFDTGVLGSHLAAMATDVGAARRFGAEARRWAEQTLHPDGIAAAYREEFVRVCGMGG